jgi:hypothetical protein
MRPHPRLAAPRDATWQPPSADLLRTRRSGGLSRSAVTGLPHRLGRGVGILSDAQPRPSHSCTSLVRGARPGDRRGPSAIDCCCERPGALDRSSVSAAFLVGCAGPGASRDSRAPCRAGPVRARMVAHAQDWPWSSVRAHLDGRDDELLRVPPPCRGRVAACNDLIVSGAEPEAFAALRAARGHRTAGRLRCIPRQIRASPRSSASPAETWTQTNGARQRNAIGKVVEVSAAANTVLVTGDGSEFVELVSCPRNFEMIAAALGGSRRCPEKLGTPRARSAACTNGAMAAICANFGPLPKRRRSVCEAHTLASAIPVRGH